MHSLPLAPVQHEPMFSSVGRRAGLMRVLALDSEPWVRVSPCCTLPRGSRSSPSAVSSSVKGACCSAFLGVLGVWR